MKIDYQRSREAQQRLVRSGRWGTVYARIANHIARQEWVTRRRYPLLWSLISDGTSEGSDEFLTFVSRNEWSGEASSGFITKSVVKDALENFESFSIEDFE